MRRKTKRFLSILMSAAMVFSLFAGRAGEVNAAKAANAANVAKAADYGISNPVIKNGMTTWDRVYFGKYYQSDTNKDGKADKNDNKTPILWRVLSVDGDDAFLLADECLDGQLYDITRRENVKWKDCTLRKWLNGEFYEEAFDEEDREAIKETEVENRNNPYYGTRDGENTRDNVYLLSLEEVACTKYGFSKYMGKWSEARQAKATDYAKEREGGAFMPSPELTGPYVNNAEWGCRTVGSCRLGHSHGDSCMWNATSRVDSAGGVDGAGTSFDVRLAVRPVLHLNLSYTTLWKKAKPVSADGAEAEETPEITPAATANPAHGVDAPVVEHGVTTWDRVYFGSYYQNDTNGDGKADEHDNKEPILWWVLSVNGDDAFLLADQCLDKRPYNEEDKIVMWENCTLRKWLKEEFYEKAFDEEERKAIEKTVVENHNNPYYGTEGGSDTEDWIYLLSLEEAVNTKYGFSKYVYSKSGTRVAEATEYARGRGADEPKKAPEDEGWWCRSSGIDKDSMEDETGVNYRAPNFYDDGRATKFGAGVSSKHVGVRPVLHLNLSVAVWKKAESVPAYGADEEETPVPTSPATPAATSVAPRITPAATSAAPKATPTPAETEFVTVTTVPTKIPSRTPATTSSATKAPMETSLATKAPMETSLATKAPMETSLATKAPMETSSATKAPMETSSATKAPMETSLATKAPMETSLATATPMVTSLTTAPTVTPLETEVSTVTTIPTTIPTAAAVPGADSYDLSNPVRKDGLTTWDTVYFGNYYQSDSETKEPICWRVLSVDGDDAFLMADKCLDCQPYHTNWDYVTWETCTLRKWLNDDFCQTAFRTDEQAAILETAVLNNNNPTYGTAGGADTKDKIYLLSLGEIVNTKYGFSKHMEKESETRQAEATNYAEVRGACGNDRKEVTWWCRSVGIFGINASYADEEGRGCDIGYSVHNDTYAVRPVLHLNLSDRSLWEKGGKVSAVNTDEEIAAAAATPPTSGSALPTSVPTPPAVYSQAMTSKPMEVSDTRPDSVEKETKLVTKSGKTYVMVDGKILKGKKQIVTVNKKSYIVDKKGAVIKGKKNKLVKVGRKYYIVNKKGVLYKNRKKIKVGKKYYKVNKKGIATRRRK